MNAVAKVETRQELAAPQLETASLLAVISRAASDPNADIEKMERLMAMYERMESRKAERAFNEAMKAAQSQMVRVAADKTNSQTHSEYATYAELDRMARPIYTSCGFALSFDTADAASPDYVRVLCYVSHEAGFTRTYHVNMPADGKGAKGGDVMTKTHAVGSAMTYGQRYLLKQIFNIAIGVDRDDDDGNAASADDYADWTAAIEACATIDALKACKKEMVDAFKGVTNVPAVLTKTYNERLNALRAQK